MTIHLARDMEALHHDLLHVCQLVEEMIHCAVDLLDEPNVERARELANRDDVIDEWDVRLEEECLKILALHQPVAIDLRRITTVLKVTAELERIADLAVNIAERAAGLLDGPRIEVPPKLDEMAKIAVEMMHDAIASYVAMDAALARDVILRDDQVDVLNREIIDELRAMMKRTPELIDPALHLFSAGRHVERVADHATNIAEDVIYLVKGEIVRHQPTVR